MLETNGLVDCVCASVHLRPAVLALETRFWTFFNHFSIWGSILVWFLFVVIYTALQVPPQPLPFAPLIARACTRTYTSHVRAQSHTHRLVRPIESCSACLPNHNVLCT